MNRYYWSMSIRDARGESIGMSSSSINSLLDDALRMNAVAITFHRGHKMGRSVTLDEVRGILNPRKKASRK